MKAIRTQAPMYGTVIRLAYNTRTWNAMCDDYPGLPSNIERDRPPTGHSGMTYSNLWEPRAHAGQLGLTSLQVGLWIHHKVLERDQSTLVATVAHECVHAAQRMYDKIGADHTAAGAGEPFAYLVDWLAGWVWDQLP